MIYWNKIKKQYFDFIASISLKVKDIFLSEEPASSIKKIKREVRVLLEKQYQDADKKKKNLDHWGHTGWHVAEAAYKCSGILKWGDEESIEDYFNRVQPALKRLAQAFRDNQKDEGGYGLGTVREVEHAITILANKYKQ